jgi:hypothetical protein
MDVEAGDHAITVEGNVVTQPGRKLRVRLDAIESAV